MSGRSEERGGAGTAGHFFRRTGSSQGCRHLGSVQSLRAGDGLRPHIPPSPHARDVRGAISRQVWERM